MRRDECDDVPEPKSPLSIRATRRPRSAASRAIPAPVIPPPMTRTSTGASLMAPSTPAGAAAGQAVTNAPDQIAMGHADVILAGGVESLTDVPILVSRRLREILVDASRARTLGARLKTFARIRPRDLIPVSPAIAEPSTGESMGQSTEK